MKVVFLKDVPKVGRKYEVKEVSDGYGRNFLIKNGLAVLADAKSLQVALGAKKQAEVSRETNQKKLEEYISRLSGLTITILSKANEEGHLFAGIKKEEILEAILSKVNIKLEADYLVLSKPIKQTGEYNLDLNLSGRKASLKLIVEASK